MKLIPTFFLSIFVLNGVSSNAQITKIENLQSGLARESFHFPLSGEARIKYCAFDGIICRIEGPVIQFFDQKLTLIDQSELRHYNEDSRYILKKTDSHIFCAELPAQQVIKIDEIRLYSFDLYDLSKNHTVKFDSESDFNSLQLFALKDKAYLVLMQMSVMKEFYILNNDLTKIDKIDLDQYKNEENQAGVWLPAFIINDQVQLTLSQNAGMKKVKQIFDFNENMELRSEQTIIYDLASQEVTTIKDGETTVSQLNAVSQSQNYPPSSIEVNGEKIWFKYEYGIKKYAPKSEIWISRNQFNLNINLSERLKTEIAAAGLKTEPGVGQPILYPDPINNSVSVQWLTTLDSRSTIESFVYFNLNSQFKLRNAYSVKLTRYPIQSYEYRSLFAAYNQFFNSNEGVAFEIATTAKKMEGLSTDESLNAYDFLFSQARVDGLCTVLQTDSYQYLFIDRKDGSTSGYVFTKK